jgi:hypothetical protein
VASPTCASFTLHKRTKCEKISRVVAPEIFFICR